MKTIEELQAAHAGELADLIRERKLLEWSPVEPDQVVAFRDDMHVKYSRCRHESIRTRPDLTVGDIRRLVGAFPPEPLMVCKGTFTTISPQAVVELMPADKRDREHSKGELDILPWYCVNGYRDEQSLKWYTVREAERLQITVELPPRILGDDRVTYHRLIGELPIVESARFEVADNIRVFWSAEGSSAEAQHMRYASGSHNTPGEVRLYWLAVNFPPPDIHDFLSALFVAAFWTI